MSQLQLIYRPASHSLLSAVRKAMVFAGRVGVSIRTTGWDWVCQSFFLFSFLMLFFFFLFFLIGKKRGVGGGFPFLVGHTTDETR